MVYSLLPRSDEFRPHLQKSRAVYTLAVRTAVPPPYDDDDDEGDADDDDDDDDDDDAT